MTANNTLHLQPITIDRDRGATLQVASGINANDRIVQIAGAELSEGQKVEPVAPRSSSAAPR